MTKKVIVCDKNHKVIHRYKNLGGFHRFITKRWKQALYTTDNCQPTSVHLYKNYKGPDVEPLHARHKLLVLFDNLDYAYIFFASYEVMEQHVKRWTNLRGLPIRRYGV